MLVEVSKFLQEFPGEVLRVGGGEDGPTPERETETEREYKI